MLPLAVRSLSRMVEYCGAWRSESPQLKAPTLGVVFRSKRIWPVVEVELAEVDCWVFVAVPSRSIHS